MGAPRKAPGPLLPAGRPGLDRSPPCTPQKPKQKSVSVLSETEPSLAAVPALSCGSNAKGPPCSRTPAQPPASFLPYRMTGGSSATWLILWRRAPCPLSWWRSSGGCGGTAGCKPALTEPRSTSSTTQPLSETGWDGRGEARGCLPGGTPGPEAGDPGTECGLSPCWLGPCRVSLRAGRDTFRSGHGLLCIASHRPAKLKAQNSNQRRSVWQPSAVP